MKKAISFLKYNSAILMPVLMNAIFYWLNEEYDVFMNITSDKVDILAGTIKGLLEVLLLTLIIYFSFLRTDKIKMKMKKSKHEYIFVSNILMGLIFFLVSFILWLFLTSDFLVIYFFIAGMTNTMITGYYLVVLIRYSQTTKNFG